MSLPNVLVFGGTGFFGQLLIEDLNSSVNCNVIVASRRPFHSSRFKTVVADLCDSDSLARALTDVEIAICAAGPFQGLPVTLAEVCLERGIHYVDLADDRAFVKKVMSLAAGYKNWKMVDSAVCTGWSTVSALSGLLASVASRGLSKLDAVRIHMAPGNKGARQTATIASLMHSVGRSFSVFRDGVWHEVQGWSEPRVFTFPSPIGERRGYLVDVPDHEIFPQRLNAQTVEFRVGSELSVLNLCLTALRLSRLDWAQWSGLFQRAAALLSWIGHDSGAIGVEISGAENRRASILAESRAERIAVMPAAVMTGMLLSGIGHGGLIQHSDWLTEEQLRSECEKRGFRLVVDQT